MEFKVFGGLELKIGPDDTRRWRAQFWNTVQQAHEGLPDACGCYIFSILHGDNYTPWYVGKTERQTFKQRVLGDEHRCRRLLARPGTTHIFLIPALTPTGLYKKPRRSPSIDYLESMLIGMALRRNSNLFNVSLVQRLTKMKVPGVINSNPGQPPHDVQRLKNLLGL